MPIHDWTRVDAGLFHAFRFAWVCRIADRLNESQLPDDMYALIERREKAEFPLENECELYAQKADRISIYRLPRELVAAIDLVSPGNKSTQAAIRAFVEKSADLIHRGIHLLVVDLFPPGNRDPQGIHKLIWDEILDEDFELPKDQPLVFASYDAGLERVAYVNFAAVGEPIPEMPVFLRPERYVNVPLEETYQTTWRVFPKALKPLLG